MKLQITVPDFIWTLPNEGPIMQGGLDLFPILGFLGRWTNPTHLIIGMGDFRWIMPRGDFNEKLVNSSGLDADVNRAVEKDKPLCFMFDMANEVYSVWFEYIGQDQEFIDAIRSYCAKTRDKKHA